MSRLPEKGDAKRAYQAINARAVAAVDEVAPGHHLVGLIDMRDGELTGDGLDGFRRVYGDLFDISETIEYGGTDLVFASLEKIDRGVMDPFSALMSLFLQATATGVIMERQRWEKRP